MGNVKTKKDCSVVCTNAVDVLCFVSNRCWSKFGGFLGILAGVIGGVALLGIIAKAGLLGSTLAALSGKLMPCLPTFGGGGRGGGCLNFGGNNVPGNPQAGMASGVVAGGVAKGEIDVSPGAGATGKKGGRKGYRSRGSEYEQSSEDESEEEEEQRKKRRGRKGMGAARGPAELEPGVTAFVGLESNRPAERRQGEGAPRLPPQPRGRDTAASAVTRTAAGPAVPAEQQAGQMARAHRARSVSDVIREGLASGRRSAVVRAQQLMSALGMRASGGSSTSSSDMGLHGAFKGGSSSPMGASSSRLLPPGLQEAARNVPPSPIGMGYNTAPLPSPRYHSPGGGSGSPSVVYSPSGTHTAAGASFIRAPQPAALSRMNPLAHEGGWDAGYGHGEYVPGPGHSPMRGMYGPGSGRSEYGPGPERVRWPVAESRWHGGDVGGLNVEGGMQGARQVLRDSHASGWGAGASPYNGSPQPRNNPLYDARW